MNTCRLICTAVVAMAATACGTTALPTAPSALPGVASVSGDDGGSTVIRALGEGRSGSSSSGSSDAAKEQEKEAGKAEQEKAEQEKAEQEKAEREKAEREKAEREKAEREKAEREKAEREKAEREKAEQEKAKQENAGPGGSVKISDDLPGDDSKMGVTPPATGSAVVAVPQLVQAVTGVCPNLVVTVGDQLVTTNALTDFQHGGCERVLRGTTVHVAGHTDAAGTMATAIRLVDRLPDSVEDNPLSPVVVPEAENPDAVFQDFLERFTPVTPFGLRVRRP